MGVRTGSPAKDVLADMGIASVRDLLHHYPRRHIDPFPRRADPRPRGRVLRDGDREGPARPQATDPSAPGDGDGHAVRRVGQPRPHVLQPAVGGLPIQGGLRGRRVRRRPALRRQATVREARGRAAPWRRTGPRAHRADHADPPSVRGHHATHDPRARVARVGAASESPIPSRPTWSAARGCSISTPRSGGSTSRRTSASSRRRPTG